MDPDDIVSGRWPSAAFQAELDALEPARLSEEGHEAGRGRVRAALAEDPLTLAGAAALLRSVRGEERTELFARATHLTEERFDRTVLLYAPCYLSSWCVHHCPDCGFNYNEPMERRQLAPEDAAAELVRLRTRGIRRVLLVAGEYPRKLSPAYVERIVRLASGIVPEVDLEVGPVLEPDYRQWNEAGAEGLVCYQETYAADGDLGLPARSSRGRRDFRLGAPERAAEAGFGRIGVGVLLGLSEPVADLLALIAHARFLQACYPAVSLTVSLPRLRPSRSGFEPEYLVDAGSLEIYLAVLRLALPDAGLVLSTRECATIRQRLLPFGVTQVRAGTVRVAGSWCAGEMEEGAQFDIGDESVAEVATDVEDLGFRPVWTAEETWPGEAWREKAVATTPDSPASGPGPQPAVGSPHPGGPLWGRPS